MSFPSRLSTGDHAGPARSRAAAASRVSTGALAAAGLVGGFAVATATGNRPLGGVVLLVAAGACGRLWLRRHPPRRAFVLGGVLLCAFVVSHGLGLVIGAWPAVLVVAAATVAVCRRWSDRPKPSAGVAFD